MMVKKVNKDGFKELFNKLKKEYNIAAPILMEKGKKELIEYGYVDTFEDIIWDQQPDSSPKNIVFPQNSYLGNDFEGHAAYDDGKPIIILGVRSCDIEAIKVLDQVFIEDESYLDLTYKKRRDKIILIGISCAERHQSCNDLRRAEALRRKVG